jgi:lipopolysaccharide export system protein LptA
LRNRQAARYARWAAMAAALIAVAVAALYVERALREARAQRKGPKALALTVEQQSAQFSYSKVEQDRTIFTIRASRATQYRDQNRAVLDDVWITIYGRDGSRNDNIHTEQCSYEPGSGAVRCEGKVEIDIDNAAPRSSRPAASPASGLKVETSNLSFNRNTGEASTTAAVEFRFPTGQGRGLGGSYRAEEGIVRVEHDVTFEMAPSDQTGGLPVTAAGSSLEIRRRDGTVVLAGPAEVKEGTRKISADKISIELDSDYHARHFVAEGHPRIEANGTRGEIVITANRLEAFLSDAGWIESVLADGNIVGTRQTTAGTDHFSAGRAEFTMIPACNLIKEMTATGGVTAELHQGDDTHLLKTEAMRLKFSSVQADATSGKAPAGAIEHQQVESAETLAPATIESKGVKDTMTLRAKQFVAEIGTDGHLDKLLGHSGVEVRISGSGAPQTVLAAEMIAKFDAHGQWENVEETGNVRFQQADRQASAARATIARPTDTIALEGSPMISDSMSRTTATNITINQGSGELHATGEVISTYIPSSAGDAVGLGQGAAHVSADALSGSVSSGHVTYTGHARLWQGDSVLDSEQVEIWRDDKKLEARGHVVAVFPQASGPLASLPGAAPASSPSPSKPTLWKITAPSLTYWNDQGRAYLEGGVVARSAQGSLESRTLEAFLDTAPAAAGGGSAAAGTGTRQLSRVLAEGNVVVREGDRRGTAQRADYTAAEGKFVLSGGQPTLTNAASDTTTGHSLTFFVANDTILVDSEEGLRTVTKHRVEK